MDTTQIYAVVNEISSEVLGTKQIATIDAQNLISLGNTILSSQTNTEGFLNMLAQRIGRTILSFRMYENQLGDMVLNDFEYGAILQKIKIDMPAAEEDKTYDLTDGESVDMFKVNKPKAHQKLFVTRTPYQFHITIQRETLKEAFLSETGLSSFISGIFGEVRNAIEFTLENLGHICLSNFIAEVSTTKRQINLISEYKVLVPDAALTPTTAMLDNDFLRFAVKRIRNVSKKMRSMSSNFNDATTTRHTPYPDQRVRIISDFQDALETVVQYSAFNKELVSLNAFKELNYWQSSTSPFKINIDRSSDGESIVLDNIIGCIHDREALGIYKISEDTITSPVNAAGRYYNTYWHEQQLWFNDLSENFVFFTLN